MKNAIWLFALTVITFLLFLPAFTKMQDVRTRNLELSKKIEELKLKNARLLEERRRLEEDPVYLERVARERMGLVRPGEIVYRLRPSKDKKNHSEGLVNQAK